LDQDSTGELDLLIEDVPKFKGYYRTNHGTVAMQLTRNIEK